MLHYTTFGAIVAGVHDARVYGGIHFRFDQIAGGETGPAYCRTHRQEPPAGGALGVRRDRQAVPPVVYYNAGRNRR